MDSPSASSPRAVLSKPRGAGLKTGALAVALVLYGLLVARFVGGYAAGSDSSGYLNHARLLREGHLQVPSHALAGLSVQEVSDWTFIPLGFRPFGERKMVPTYPVGLPLLILGVSALTGWDFAPQVTLWLHAMMGLILFYLLARRFGLSPFSAAMGALLLGASPLYLVISLQALSDGPALVWCLAAVYCAWRSRSHAGWAIPAGVAVAIAVLVRPTNLLIFGPVALCLGLSWRRWLALLAGGAPGAVFLAVVNHDLYGSIFASGYGDVSSSFSPAFVARSLKHYVIWLPVLLTPAVVLLLAAPWAMRRDHRQIAGIVLLWMVLFFGCYAFYYFTYETWSYLRFILPAFPPVILTLLITGEAISRNWSRRRQGIAAIAMAGGILAWDGYWVISLRALQQPGQAGEEGAYQEAADWARSHLPANAIVFCMQVSGAFNYYTGFSLVRWDLGEPRLLEKIAPAAAAAGRPLYAALFPWEATKALEREIPGHWTQVGTSRQVSFWRFDGLEPRTTGINPARYLGTFRDGVTELTLRNGGEWFDVERDLDHVWCWSGGAGILDLGAQPVVSTTARLEFAVRSLAPGTLQVAQEGQVLWRGPVGRTRTPVALNCKLIDGHARLEFSSDVPPTPEKFRANARQLTFAIYDPKPSLLKPTR